MSQHEFNPTPWVVLGVTFLVLTIGGGLYGCPQYSVYSADLDGKAALARANQSREILVREATAKRDAARLMAEAEVERARGVAQANKIIGDSLHGNEAYLRYLWINNMSEHGKGNTVIYIPTEAGLPILEAERLSKSK